MDISEIKRIAVATRQNFEKKRVDHNLLVILYKQYHDIGDIETFVSRAVETFPKGNCGLSALYLQTELGGEIIQGQFKNEGHTFLMRGDVVIDITADQFDGPAVYVGSFEYPWQRKD